MPTHSPTPPHARITLAALAVPASRSVTPSDTAASSAAPTADARPLASRAAQFTDVVTVRGYLATIAAFELITPLTLAAAWSWRTGRDVETCERWLEFVADTTSAPRIPSEIVAEIVNAAAYVRLVRGSEGT